MCHSKIINILTKYGVRVIIPFANKFQNSNLYSEENISSKGNENNMGVENQIKDGK